MSRLPKCNKKTQYLYHLQFNKAILYQKTSENSTEKPIGVFIGVFQAAFILVPGYPYLYNGLPENASEPQESEG